MSFYHPLMYSYLLNKRGGPYKQGGWQNFLIREAGKIFLVDKRSCQGCEMVLIRTSRVKFPPSTSLFSLPVYKAGESCLASVVHAVIQAIGML